MANRYRTVIVDDHPIVISGISGLLSDFDSVEITAKLTSGEMLLKYMEDSDADLILMDILLGIGSIFNFFATFVKNKFI